MVPNNWVDSVRKQLNKKTQFNCIQPNEEASDDLLEAGFSVYSPYNCILHGRKELYPNCNFLGECISNEAFYLKFYYLFKTDFLFIAVAGGCFNC